LSMTIVPCFAYFSAIAREVVAPAEKIAMSRSLVSAVEASSTVIFWPFHSIIEPADFADAKNRTDVAGKFRSINRVRITLPTMPVAPTMPRDSFFVTRLGYLSDQPPVAWINSVCRYGLHTVLSRCSNCQFALHRMEYFDLTQLRLKVL
jgi:hypothetical protein